MTKRLVCPARGEVAWAEVTLRELGAADVRVRCTHGCEKHGTMMAFFKGYANDRGRWDANLRMHLPHEGMLWNYPIPLGNMQVGVVTQAGESSGRAVGERVFFHGFFQPETVLPGVDTWSLPDGVAWQDAMLMDPAEFALGAIRDGHVRIGDRVAVFGLGAIGLCVVQLLRTAGASQIIASDPVAERRELALTLGATHVTTGNDDVGGQIRELTAGHGVDVAIDFSGAMPALQAAIRGVAYGGTIVCGAFPAPFGPGLDLGGEAHMNRPRIVFSRACSDPNPDHPRWDHPRIQHEVVALIRGGHLRGSAMLTPVVPFDALRDVYPQIAMSPAGMIKLGVEYPPTG
ncbi:MAG: zinc-binding alcohol dehydrogenase [Fimbriimonadaceae bacterium]|nr:zinc-binding alcohol dehydrogenase [Fimbriimonadaceae bacterium]